MGYLALGMRKLFNRKVLPFAKFKMRGENQNLMNIISVSLNVTRNEWIR